jgi:hypothetical protein
MASADTNQGLRRLVARMHGYRCYLCGVPTAATIEHVLARKGGGRSGLENLQLACPYCNSTKGDRPVSEFLAEEKHLIPPPDDLPASMKDMLAKCYGVHKRAGVISTGTPNAKLELTAGVACALVRAGSRDSWHRFVLGEADDPRVVWAAWDYLRRHNTPTAKEVRARRRRSAA